jgi:hypothetical protein
VRMASACASSEGHLVRDLRGLLHPNLAGLKREEVRPSTWRLGVAGILGMCGFLGFGLVVVLVKQVVGPEDSATMWLAVGWLCLIPPQALLATCFWAGLMRDGWSRRSALWRGCMLAIVLGCGAMMILAAWLLTTMFWHALS